MAKLGDLAPLKEGGEGGYRLLFNARRYSRTVIGLKRITEAVDKYFTASTSFFLIIYTTPSSYVFKNLSQINLSLQSYRNVYTSKMQANTGQFEYHDKISVVIR